MTTLRHLARHIARVAVLGFAVAGAAAAQDVAPHAIDIPPWFVETFLDLREDVGDAAREGKRLMVYFGQDGCPYCTLLMKTNFSQRRIVDKTRKHFIAVALNIWGDRETKWIHGGQSLYVRDPDGRRIEFKTPGVVVPPKLEPLKPKKSDD